MADSKLTMMANAIRMLAVDAVERARSGHPGLPMGVADIATVLFAKHMRFDPAHPGWPDRDRFVLSAGHGAMLLYALNHLLGFEHFPIEELRAFRQLGSKTPGHPERHLARGIEATTGPPGQGLATAVGIALAERIMNAEFGNEVVDHRTVVLVSEDDLMEGISHEAIALAGHLSLNKLIVIYDDNGVSLDGPVALAQAGDAMARFEAAGFAVEAVDGHDLEAIDEALAVAKTGERPSLIAAKTTMGKGSPNREGTAAIHSGPLGTAETVATRAALEWTSDPFDVPEETRDAWRIAGLRAAHAHREWQARYEAMEADARAEFDRRLRGQLPTELAPAIANLRSQLLRERGEAATRRTSQRVLGTVATAVPELVGGSAGLSESTNTKTDHMAAIAASDYAGRYVHYGMREHAMAAVMNGLALSGGLIPYAGTFLVLSDYGRPALRLGAVMGLRVIHVMTHDSIGVGEDGTAFQPVEQLAALRAMPNVVVVRPADAVETAEAWEIALEREGPTVLVLTRQSLPSVAPSDSGSNLSRRGAYRVREVAGPAVATIFASGSEVRIALAAAEILASVQIAAEVISCPSLDLFAREDADYREAIIGEAPVKVAVEAAVRQGWDAIIGPDGIFVGMDGFGASGAYEALYEHFEITPERVASAVRERLDR